MKNILVCKDKFNIRTTWRLVQMECKKASETKNFWSCVQLSYQREIQTSKNFTHSVWQFWNSGILTWWSQEYRNCELWVCPVWLYWFWSCERYTCTRGNCKPNNNFLNIPDLKLHLSDKHQKHLKHTEIDHIKMDRKNPDKISNRTISGSYFF